MIAEIYSMNVLAAYFSQFLFVQICISIFILFTVQAQTQNPTPAQSLYVQTEERPLPPDKKYDSRNYVKVAVLQWAAAYPTPIGVTPKQAEQYKQKNRLAIAEFATQAKNNGAELLVTPELSVIDYPEDDYNSKSDLEPYVETIPGPTTEYFKPISKKLKLFIQLGLAEKDSNNVYYNTAVVIAPSGEIVAKYRKMNLYGNEGSYFKRGDKLATFKGPFGEIGVIVCADIYNYRPMLSYKNLGIKTISMGATWTLPNPMNWFQSAAEDYALNILAANQPYFPDAGVIDSTGYIQSHIHSTRGLAYGFLPRVK
jgi:predicted amidohydrolase